MPIISVEIMKITDKREVKKTAIEKQTKTERSEGNRSYSGRVRASLYNTPCNRFYNNHIINICYRQLL